MNKLIRHYRRIKRFRDIVWEYREAFLEEDVPLPERWFQQLREVYWAPTEGDCPELPPAPPCGWAPICERTGGVPWHGVIR